MFTNKKSLLALSVASAIALSGCFSDKKGADAPPPVEPPPAVIVQPEAPVALAPVANVNVIDAESADLVAANISFFENGTASTNVVDIDGNVTATIDSTDGSFTFQLKSGASVSEVTAIVTADTYITKSYVIELEDLSEGNLDLQLKLISKDTAGVATTEVTASVAGGATPDEITGGVADGKAAANVTVAAGTILQDADGNAIPGDSVSLAIVTADTSTSSGTAITPEGLNAAESATTLTPVSVASIVMVDNTGVKIKKFSQPITIEMALPEDKGFTTGDELTLLSQNEDTGVWTTETQKLVVGDLVTAENYYNASFATDHLTTFAGVTVSDTCSVPVRILTTGDAIPADGLYVDISSASVNFSKKLKANNPILVKLNKLSKRGIATDTTANLVITDSSDTVWFETTSEVALCGDIPVVLDGPAVVNETLSLVAQCSNDTSLTVGASGALVKYSLGNKSKKVAKDEGEGTYALRNLLDGSTYNVSVTYKGSLADLGTKTYTITADGTDETQTESIVCDTATGGTGATGGS
ncbi:hypothetical protein H4J51_07755 [Colwellia sp. MB02u-18]|uniref:hypothetical protein n=1 Tax=unclassified Colwellia TaxID=196834 RepID=UPI0015F5ACDB|nr:MULTISPECIES: hypothetical protein [unclassified Colwellia]MBA6223803.1 hypothetical protein [Colwellia sp. MB3u-45]MBA6265959.1 hypothetical protein [Colwellia sp. MB3u-43]MBA6319984.1 hypothetical protein [Colwellia sp. MB02u-19]MBA6324472.1 hypothetical protein [Colwellia sp. MB02u-18]MBA6330627.1 hypothetical protein [Colwellia sp. MB02u-12]